MFDNNPTGNNSPDKLAPHSSDAEEAVLGSILIHPEVLLEVAAFLQAEDFFVVRNSWIFAAIQAVHERGEAVDYLTVVEELRTRNQLDQIGGAAYITYLINNTPTHIHAETYGRYVERASIRRRLLDAATKIGQVALQESAEIQEVIDSAEAELFAATEKRMRRDMTPINIAASEYFDRIEYLYSHPDESLGLPSGFSDLDQMLGGLQKSDLCIIAARPGMGKTSFMLSLALNAAKLGHARIAVFSMEMSNEQLIQRLISAETGINSAKLRIGNLDEREWGLFTEATAKVSAMPIFMDDTPAMSVPQMRTKTRRMYREHGLDMVIVDYLQLMSGGVSKSDNRVQEISAISRGLKELARELNVPVLAAAQLSRAVEQRGDKRPQLSDLRESGCLAGDTLIYLPDSGKSVAIRDLCRQSGFRVLSSNQETWKLEPAVVSNAFCTGVKPVYRLTTGMGHIICATANHKFMTRQGWKRLDELSRHMSIAVSDDDQKIWDSIETVEFDRLTDVYDLTVPTNHNFTANSVISHNSIEQDADIVMFIYRDDMYNENSERPNQADIIVAKHRNGPTGVITLFFRKELTQFTNMQKSNINLASF